MSYYKVLVTHKYITDLYIVWNICNIPLYRHDRKYIDIKQKPLPKG